jgi:Ca2+-binding EF-hand superfamily protein
MRPTTKPPPPPEEPKKFDPDKYTTMTLHREEVIEIKQAFDIFDEDLSGKLDPC